MMCNFSYVVGITQAYTQTWRGEDNHLVSVLLESPYYFLRVPAFVSSPKRMENITNKVSLLAPLLCSQ